MWLMSEDKTKIFDFTCVEGMEKTSIFIGVNELARNVYNINFFMKSGVCITFDFDKKENRDKIFNKLIELKIKKSKKEVVVK